MKTLVTALALGALIAIPSFVQSADAQRANRLDIDARERAIQECMAMNKSQPHDPYSASGGLEHHYQACMANRGQPY